MTELTPGFDDETYKILDKVYKNLAEGITGIAASKKEDLYLSAGYLLQRARSGEFLKTFMNEWNKFREKGRIQDEYTYTEQHQECLQEMLDFLDNDSPDQIRFSVLKNIFLNTATESFSSRDDVLPQQLLRIGRSLNSAEVLIIQTAYKLSKEGEDASKRSTRDWRYAISRNSPLGYPELVESNEQTLENKGLIHRRVDPDNSMFSKPGHFRLTGLGLRLCEFMTEYKPETDNE